MPALSELVQSEAIALDVAVDSWEEAIRASGRLLESAGVTDPDYTQAMSARRSVPKARSGDVTRGVSIRARNVL